MGFVVKPKIKELDTRVTTLETALPNAGSESKDCLAEELTVQPYQGITDEVDTAMGVSKNEELTMSVRNMVRNLAITMGSSYELYVIDKPKIAELENRIAALEGKA